MLAPGVDHRQFAPAAPRAWCGSLLCAGRLLCPGRLTDAMRAGGLETAAEHHRDDSSRRLERLLCAQAGRSGLGGRTERVAG